MIEVEAKLKKWGSSVGVLLSKPDIEKEKLKIGENVVLRVSKKSNVLRETFGSLKFRKPTEKLLKEIDKELWND
ncbi:MAG: hypothetical protein HYW50_04980 [Candidatus Diapherotrites archaeon]|nr:hypothetical protein [Candidatus Diapherotrites archaeon]